MDISILCTDRTHPVLRALETWVCEMTARGHHLELVFDRSQLRGGDVLFLVSCSQIIRESERDRFKATLVLHASDLPAGRGWSPHVWAVLRGESVITVTLLEAADSVDAGRIWLKTNFSLLGHELLPEINEKLFAAEIELMTRAIENYGDIRPVEQVGEPGPYMQKRSPSDSRMDPHRPIAEQFDLLRIVDNDRYPAFFDLRGHRYLIRIEKVEHEQ